MPKYTIYTGKTTVTMILFYAGNKVEIVGQFSDNKPQINPQHDGMLDLAYPSLLESSRLVGSRAKTLLI